MVFPAIGFAEMRRWDDRDGITVGNLFIAVLSHHGRPLNLNADCPKNPEIWQPCGQLNPQEYTKRIGQLARQWFPAAFAVDAPPLPAAPAFQHHFLGLGILADWIGSAVNPIRKGSGANAPGPFSYFPQHLTTPHSPLYTCPQPRPRRIRRLFSGSARRPRGSGKPYFHGREA